MIEQITLFEQEILRWIYNMHHPILDWLMKYYTMLGNHGEIWIAIGLVLLLFNKHRKAGFLVLLSLVFMLAINDLFLKEIFQRARPFENMSGIDLLVDPPTSFAFPSGHTASSFAAAFVLVHFYKKHNAYIIMFLASLMAFSRLYLTVHYPTDILAGILVGYLCSKLAFWTFDYVNQWVERRRQLTSNS